MSHVQHAQFLRDTNAMNQNNDIIITHKYTMESLMVLTIPCFTYKYSQYKRSSLVPFERAAACCGEHVVVVVVVAAPAAPY